MECKHEKKGVKCTRNAVIKKNNVLGYCSYHNQLKYQKNYYKKLTKEQKINKIEQLKNKINVLEQLLS